MPATRCTAMGEGFGAYRCAAAVTGLWFTLALSLSGSAAESETSPRATKGLVALYTFEPTSAGLVRDRSGHDKPLDLRLDKPQSVAWRGGALVVGGTTRITSPQPASRLVRAIKATGELTIETWFKSLDLGQAGPARIVSLSADTGHRNFTIGQEGQRFEVRVRTSATNENGIPALSSTAQAVTGSMTHLVYTRSADGNARLYLNGHENVSRHIAGDFSSWNEDYRLILANELTGDRPWRGEFQLVAIYQRALSTDEVARHFAAGVPPAVDLAAKLPPAAKRQIDFVRDIQPILRQHCHECHAAGNQEGGLDLGSRPRALAGGGDGPVLTPGASDQSRLIHLVAGVESDAIMPPTGERLTDDQVGLLRAWIDQGLPWPEAAFIADPRQEQARLHWAFQPLRHPPPPTIRNAVACRTPLDRFILARLEAAGIGFSPPASPRALIRRLAFDLVGLPPSPDEIEAFDEAMRNDPDHAWESLVDRLLASPHFGERWGRHWLDVAHYADSDGMEADRDRPFAYPYRDFVIRAWNADMPFDQFVRWQIAGDEYEPRNPSAVAATGFLAAGPREVLPENLLEFERLRNRYNELDDLVSTLGTGLLGLTLGCARCHDHKYDAIPTRDYYQLMSVFHSGDRAEVTTDTSPQEKIFAYRDFGPDPRPTWLFKRADFYDRRQTVPLGFVSILTHGKTPEEFWTAARNAAPQSSSTRQRRALAEWLTDVEHGSGALLARVLVNRLWLHHFGEPLVPTVADFGIRSDPPSHPELLEWLAQDLVEHDWNLKRLHRLILTSTVYCQTSNSTHGLSLDPQNRLLWRMRPRKLEAEILRDTMLAVSGTLNREPFGPGFKPPIPPEAMVARNLKDPYPAKAQDSPATRRRSVYMFHKRVVPYPLLQAFDKPDAQQSCARRDNTVVAPQALALLNDPFIREVALDFARRLSRETDQSPPAVARRAFGLMFGREPGPAEMAAATEFLATQFEQRTARNRGDSADAARQAAFADFCQTLFSLNEFLYID